VFFGLHGGVIADRFDRRRLLIVTQSALALMATAIGLLAATQLIQFGSRRRNRFLADASWVKPGVVMVAICCGLLSIVHIWLTLPVGVYFALAGVFLLGVSSGFFNVTVTSTLQLRARDDVRGRVMAMYSIGILGSGLVGAPLAGTLADMVGVSDTFLIIAAICASTAAATAWAWFRTENL
jgi:MFS family permease